LNRFKLVPHCRVAIADFQSIINDWGTQTGVCAPATGLRYNKARMTETLAPGDDLIFQLESGFGLLRVIAIDQLDSGTIWHLLAYEELFPDVESAEQALAQADSLHVRNSHMALTARAFERTPAARLGNRPVTAVERIAYQQWVESGGEVADRSALLMLGIR
jgi:hypothetical protein